MLASFYISYFLSRCGALMPRTSQIFVPCVSVGKVRSYSALASQCHLLGVVARSCGFTSLFLFSLPLLSALTRRPLFLSCSCKARQLLFSEVPFKTPLFPPNLVLYCHYCVCEISLDCGGYAPVSNV